MVVLDCLYLVFFAFCLVCILSVLTFCHICILSNLHFVTDSLGVTKERKIALLLRSRIYSGHIGPGNYFSG